MKPRFWAQTTGRTGLLFPELAGDGRQEHGCGRRTCSEVWNRWVPGQQTSRSGGRGAAGCTRFEFGKRSGLETGLCGQLCRSQSVARAWVGSLHREQLRYPRETQMDLTCHKVRRANVVLQQRSPQRPPLFSEVTNLRGFPDISSPSPPSRLHEWYVGNMELQSWKDPTEWNTGIKT